MKILISPYQATFDAIQKRLEEMGKGEQMKDVLKKAIDDLAKETKEQLHEETKGMYTIKASQFRKSDIRENSRNGSSMLTVKGTTIPIRKGYRNRKNSKRKAASALIRKASGALKTMELKSGGRSYKAFVATMKSGHEGIFQRVPGKRMKSNPKKEAIQEMVSLSRSKAAEMAYREKISDGIQTEMSFQLLKHMNAVIGG